jgi:hypothetical protein
MLFGIYHAWFCLPHWRVSTDRVTSLLTMNSCMHQSVLINSKLTTSLLFRTGVTQGSVLGPILFTLYLTGLGDVIASFHIHYVIYAADIHLFHRRYCVSDIPSAGRCNCCNQTARTSLLTEFLVIGSIKFLQKVFISKIISDGVRVPRRGVNVNFHRILSGLRVRYPKSRQLYFHFWCVNFTASWLVIHTKS